MRVETLFFPVLARAVTADSSLTRPVTLGLSPDLQVQVQQASTFTCDGNTRQLPVQALNDNYCDCVDGTDEPGTSACSHTSALFYCQNEGYFPHSIPTSYVQDQICDCCDGSDEAESRISCVNTCEDRMTAYLEEKAEMRERYQAGSRDRQALVEAAQTRLDEIQTKVSELQALLPPLEEEKDRLQREKEMEEDKETQERMQVTVDSKKAIMEELGVLDLSIDQLGWILLDVLQKADSLTPDKVVEYINRERKPLEVDSELVKKEKAFKEAEETETETDATRPLDELLTKLKGLDTYSRPEVKEAKDKYDQVHRDWREKTKELETYQKKLERDYGPEHQFLALDDACFENNDGAYKYKVCMFGDAKQDSTLLGRMQHVEDGKVLVFEDGAKCWHGPKRQMKVTLACGPLPSKLSTVEEPETCVYQGTLYTPLACDDVYKKELEKGEEIEVHPIEFQIEPLG